MRITNDGRVTCVVSNGWQRGKIDCVMEGVLGQTTTRNKKIGSTENTCIHARRNIKNEERN